MDLHFPVLLNEYAEGGWAQACSTSGEGRAGGQGLLINAVTSLKDGVVNVVEMEMASLEDWGADPSSVMSLAHPEQ